MRAWQSIIKDQGFTFDDLLDAHVDALSSEFGVNLNYYDTNRAQHAPVIDRLDDSIRGYVQETIVSMLAVRNALPFLRPDKLKQGRCLEEIVEGLSAIRDIQEKDAYGADKILCLIAHDESRNEIRERVRDTVNALNETLRQPEIVRVR